MTEAIAGGAGSVPLYDLSLTFLQRHGARQIPAVDAVTFFSAGTLSHEREYSVRRRNNLTLPRGAHYPPRK